MSDVDELALWNRWRDLCALGRMEASERAVLEQTIGDRFRSRLRHLKAQRVVGALVSAMPADRECAHGFETYCALHARRDGKSYKHWLLTRGRRDLDTVQSGVMLLVRNVVKAWLRERTPLPSTISLHEPVGDHLTLEQCLPVEDAAAAGAEEMREWMGARYRSWLNGLCDEEAAALGVRARGWVMSDPRARRVTGYGKTTLHKYLRGVTRRWAEEARARFPEVPPEQAAAGVLDVLDRAGKDLWKKIAENSDSPAFGVAEVKDDE